MECHECVPLNKKWNVGLSVFQLNLKTSKNDICMSARQCNISVNQYSGELEIVYITL